MSMNTCNNSRVTSKTLPICDSKNVAPKTANRTDYITKIPVVIAERSINIDVEADIYLEQPAIEIKRIKKTVFLTQAKLLVIPSHHYPHEFKGKLFLKGFIRKNIEYATCECRTPGNDDCCCPTGSAISGDIVHTTVDAPFHCVTMIDEFLFPPVIKFTDSPQTIIIFKQSKHDCKCCNETLIGSDECQFHSTQSIPYNEDFDVEIEKVKIVEVDLDQELILPEDSEYPVCHCAFNKVTEKLDLTLVLKILQKQQIKIPNPYPPMGHPSKDCRCKK